MGYSTIPKGERDGVLRRIYTAGKERSIWLRPDSKGTTRTILVVQKDADGDERLSPSGQKAFLRERFANVGWEAERVLQGLEATDDLYFDVLRQVKLDRWSKGHVVLTGDAAWCATPIAGIGTTLAIVGAYVMAGELSRSADLREALTRYEEVLRPYVKKGQNVSKLAPKMLQPQTLLGVALQRSLLRMVDTPAIRQVVTKLFVSSVDEFELPSYELVPLVGRVPWIAIDSLQINDWNL